MTWSAELERSQAELERAYEQQARREAEAIADLANIEKQKAEQKAQRLAEMLKAMGIDTDEI